MKRIFSTFLTTAAVCAFISATPVAAQETITGAPRGETPVTAEPPGAGFDNNMGPLGVVGAILGAPFEITGSAANATTGSSAGTTQSDAQCHLTRDFYGSQGRYTAVCGL
jgi:hypothetical protein